MMMRDVVFDDSPLGQYLASQQLQVPQAPPAAMLQPATSCSGSMRWLRRVFFRRRVAALLPSCNDSYRRVVGATEEASLERDYADVKSVLKDEQVVWPVWGGAAVVVAALGTAMAGSSWWMALMLFLVGMGCIVAAQSNLVMGSNTLTADALSGAFVAVEKQLKKSVSLIREVELVARGYRIGATVQSPAALLEDAERGNARRLEQLRWACKEAVESVLRVARAYFVGLRVSHGSLATDVGQMLQLIDGLNVATCGCTIQNLSEWTRAVHVLGMGLSIVHVRASLLYPRQSSFLSLSHDGIVAACEAATAQLRDARSVNWRSKTASVTIAKQKSLDPAIAALQSGIRTLGAKSVLFGELTSAEDKAEAKRCIGVELGKLLDEWNFQCEKQNQTARRDEEDPARPRQAVQTETKLVGGLEIDVIGGEKEESGARQATPLDLEGILQIYEARTASVENEEVRLPTKSREERIKEMYERKAAEESARAELRVVSALMSELENVLVSRSKN